MLAELLDAPAFARLLLYLGESADAVATELQSSSNYALPPRTARAVVAEAAEQRQLADAAQAKLSRLLIDAGADAAGDVAMPFFLVLPNRKQEGMRAACEAAGRLGARLGLAANELAALVHGAFLVEQMVALVIAQAFAAPGAAMTSVASHGRRDRPSAARRSRSSTAVLGKGRLWVNNE